MVSPAGSCTGADVLDVQIFHPIKRHGTSHLPSSLEERCWLKMSQKKHTAFIAAQDTVDLSSGQRFLFYLWSFLALLVSSGCIAVLSLMLAYGLEGAEYGRMIFCNYFQHFSLFLLNWLPIFLFQLLIYGLFGRQWIAYLFSSALFLLASVGHYYKMKFRYEPFTFSDLPFIGAALGVAGRYAIFPFGKRVLLAIAAIPAGTLLMALLVKGRMGRRPRALLSLAVAVSILPLWRFVYSDEILYYETSVTPPITVMEWQQQFSAMKGFVYPFIHSIRYAVSIPEGYDKKEAAALLSGYEDAPIPEERKVNLMVFQLESFCDMSALDIDGLSPEVYERYHALENETYNGRLIVNVSGGNTIDTERCFLSGTYYMANYRSSSYSNVRYLRSQGYTAVGSHPNQPRFYSRSGVNTSLGFEDYWFLNEHYEWTDDWYPDKDLFPEVLRQFRDLTERGEKVFSFNVTIQGHSPYESEKLLYDTVYWPGEGCSDEARYTFNNYLGSVLETQEAMCFLTDSLREDPEPAVLLFYGDHMPGLGDIYQDLGINIDTATTEGFLNYYSTNYLIWANNAAKEMLGDSFTGKGPDVSVCFLMNLLFDKLGWEGSAFNQFGNEIRKTLPVVTSNGFYYENGTLTKDLSPEGQQRFRDLSFATYYANRNYDTSAKEAK